MRLDQYLAQEFPNISRSKFQKAIKNGEITVNEKTVTSHYQLCEGDIVSGKLPTLQVDIVVSPNFAVTFPILAPDENFLVIEKPAGLIVHQSEIHPQPDTLINGLLAQFPNIKNIGENPIRPGLVHRLDKEVSGLMVIALTQKMFQHLKSQFQKGEVIKEYIGIVHGKLSQKSGEVNLPITRSKTKKGIMATRTDATGRSAKTSYEVLKEGPANSLLRLTLHTGRTHQIRVHMKSLGHPLLGDELYATKGTKVKKLGRVLLHATKLSFLDLNNQRHTFDSPHPQTWEGYL